jgi:hypothetical protein
MTEIGPSLAVIGWVGSGVGWGFVFLFSGRFYFYGCGWGNTLFNLQLINTILHSHIKTVKKSKQNK